jgi:hypothetical protein
MRDVAQCINSFFVLRTLLVSPRAMYICPNPKYGKIKPGEAN